MDDVDSQQDIQSQKYNPFLRQITSRLSNKSFALRRLSSYQGIASSGLSIPERSIHYYIQSTPDIRPGISFEVCDCNMIDFIIVDSIVSESHWVPYSSKWLSSILWSCLFAEFIAVFVLGAY